MSEEVKIILRSKYKIMNHVQPSVEAKMNTKLHESSRGEITFLSHILEGGISEFLQEIQDTMYLSHVFWKLLILRFVPFRNRFEQPFVHFIWPTHQWRKTTKDESLSDSLGEE